METTRYDGWPVRHRWEVKGDEDELLAHYEVVIQGDEGIVRLIHRNKRTDLVAGADVAFEILRLAERVRELEGKLSARTDEVAVRTHERNLWRDKADGLERQVVAMESELDQWKGSAITERDLGNLERKGAESVGRRLGELEKENARLRGA